MADLSAARLQVGQSAFFHIEVDLFGPCLVKQVAVLLKATSAYLHTCLTMRNTSIFKCFFFFVLISLFLVFRRCIGRRSTVAHIHLDNGSSFVRADKILRKAIQDWNQHRIDGFLLPREID